MSQKSKLSIWFWIVSILFLIWNIFGVSNYLMSVTSTADSLAAQGYDASQIEFLLNMPPLYASVFAIAVWSGLLASLLLLFRRKLAVPIYLLSLIFVTWSFVFDFIGGSFDVLGRDYLAIMCFVLVVAVLEFFVSTRFLKRNYLR